MDYVLYHRLSKKKMTGNQYGIDSQETDIRRFLDQQENYSVLGSFAEYYSGKGDWKQRDELVKAVELCKTTGATLVVAKVDRLGRNVASVSALLELVKVKIAIMPSAENMVINILAVLAEEEVKGISDRIKKGLAVAKEKGVILGAANPNYKRTNFQRTRSSKKKEEFLLTFKDSLIAYRNTGTTYQRIADQFNRQGKKTIRGSFFDAKAVQRMCTSLSI